LYRFPKELNNIKIELLNYIGDYNHLDFVLDYLNRFRNLKKINLGFELNPKSVYCLHDADIIEASGVICGLEFAKVSYTVKTNKKYKEEAEEMARRLNEEGHEIKVKVMKCDCDDPDGCDGSDEEEYEEEQEEE